MGSSNPQVSNFGTDLGTDKNKPEAPSHNHETMAPKACSGPQYGGHLPNPEAFRLDPKPCQILSGPVVPNPRDTETFLLLDR